MNQRTDFKEFADITLSDGTTLELSEKDFTVSNNSVVDGAGISSIPLGVAIERYIQIEIDNHDGRFAEYNFTGAIIELYLKFQLSATTETVRFGKFTVVTPETYGQTVIITAVDDMYKADIAYGTTLTFPTTAKAVLVDSCNTCDISLKTSTFTNNNFIINEAPSSEYTHRQVIGYISMLACGNARINTSGYLEILEYNFSTPLYSLSNWKTGFRVETSDVTITGIKMVYENEEGEEKQAFSGLAGYVLALENPLATGREAELVSYVADKLVNKSFRPFSGEHIGYPIAEFMDYVVILDRNGNTYFSFITDVSFTYFGFTSMKNSAEPGIRQRSTYANPSAEVIKKAQQLVTAERNAREQAVKGLQAGLAATTGMYSTEEVQEDGSTIYYMHDKPTVAESKNIVKFTSEAIGFSTDGGITYPYGFTLNGEMVMNVIKTEGLSADYINTGYLSADRIKGGHNLMTGGYDTFEQITKDSLYIDGELNGSALISIVTTEKYYGTKSLKITPSSGYWYQLCGPNGRGFVYGVPGKMYKASCYVKATSSGNFTLSAMCSDTNDFATANFGEEHTVTSEIGTTWTRVETPAFTLTEEYPYISILLEPQITSTHYFDAFMIEEVNNAEQGASDFVSAGTTVIDGGNINTKSITADQIEVEELSAIAAKIAGFILKDSKFYTDGKESLESTNNGVYLGSDGLSIGGGFKASANGKTTSGEFFSLGEGTSYTDSAYKMTALTKGLLKFLWGINPDNPYELGGVTSYTEASTNTSPDVSGVIMHSNTDTDANYHFAGLGTSAEDLVHLALVMFAGIDSPLNVSDYLGFDGESVNVTGSSMSNYPLQAFTSIFARKNFRCGGTIYDSSGTAVTSDINKKNCIEELDEELVAKFLNALNPVSFKYNDGTSGRKHWGLIAQHVKETLDMLGIDTSDFAGYIEDASDGEITCYIRPTEFIAPLIKGYQALYKENQTLKKDISAIKQALNID